MFAPPGGWVGAGRGCHSSGDVEESLRRLWGPCLGSGVILGLNPECCEDYLVAMKPQLSH